MWKQLEAKMRDWNRGVGDDPSCMPSVYSNQDVASLARHHGQAMDWVTNSLSRSLIIEAWTLFESISEDIWEAAVNFHPTVLGALNGKARITFDDLQKNNFDVRGKAGTLLKRRLPQGFRSLEGIMESYRLAFTEQFLMIEEVLKDSGLRYAAAVRNLLIHKRGIPDQEFKDDVTGISGVPAFVLDNPLYPFQITGELCAELTDDCCECACWLLTTVHAWLIGHPETRKDSESGGGSS